MRRSSLTEDTAASSAALRLHGVIRRTRSGHIAQARFVGITSVGRVVSNLERSVAFYRALGFHLHPTGARGWRRDRAMNRIYGIRRSKAVTRVAKLSIDAVGRDQKFMLYLREFRGIRRTNLSDHTAWEPGVSHFGLVPADADALWSQLAAKGLLRARSWGEALIAPPGQTQGVVAYITDPDGIDIEIIRKRPAAAAADGRPARPACLPGLNHVGLVVLHAVKERAFYERALGAKLCNARAPWLKGDFFDGAVGGHGNILRIYNESFPFVPERRSGKPSRRMNFELIEFKNRKKPVRQSRITDIGVGCVRMQTNDLDALLLRAQAAGAKVISDGVVPMNDGTRIATISDPGVGGFIELFEPPKRGRRSAADMRTGRRRPKTSGDVARRSSRL